MDKEDLSKELVTTVIKDRRADRRWRNIRFAGWILILLIYAILIFGPSKSKFGGKPSTTDYVSLVRLNGIIMPGNNFSAKRVIPQLQRAFSDQTAKGVVLLINSPGGSPVQASIIHDKVIALKKKYKKKVIVVGEDALASGAYLVATAGDKIYVNKSTLTGSIGVIMNGFGFVDTIKKLGITRRAFTAGDHKDRLDPFETLNPNDIAKIQSILDQAHQDFIDYVVEGRGDRLKGDKKELFSGDFWLGQKAVQLGLADGTENLWTAIKNDFNVTHYRDYTAKKTLLQAILQGIGAELKLHLSNNTMPLKSQVF